MGVASRRPDPASADTELDYAATIRGNAVFDGVVAALALDGPLGALLVHAAARRLDVSLADLTLVDLRNMRDEIEAGLRLVMPEADAVDRAIAAFDAFVA